MAYRTLKLCFRGQKHQYEPQNDRNMCQAYNLSNIPRSCMQLQYLAWLKYLNVEEVYV